MRYTVVQERLEIPPVEALKRAFRVLPSLTDVDAHTLANDAYGILVKNLSKGDAAALQGALRAEGIETSVMPSGKLPGLPATRGIQRLDCGRDALVLYDPLNRPITVDWGHLLVIAAGEVRLFESQRTIHRSTRAPSLFNKLPRYGIEPKVTEEVRTREGWTPRLLLTLILTNAVAGFQAQAHKFHFHYLGERQARDTVTNLGMVVRDLAAHAPKAACNRGAFFLRQDPPTVFAYPSRNAYHEEMIWLLWRLRGGSEL